MSTFDGVMSALFIFGGGWFFMQITSSFFRPRGEDELGYIPGSDEPEWGWPLTYIVAVLIVLALAGLFGYVGAAIFY